MNKNTEYISEVDFTDEYECPKCGEYFVAYGKLWAFQKGQPICEDCQTEKQKEDIARDVWG